MKHKRFFLSLLVVYVLICALSCFTLSVFAFSFCSYITLCTGICVLLGLLFYRIFRPILAQYYAAGQLFSSVSIFQNDDSSVLQKLESIHRFSEITSACKEAEGIIEQNIFQEYYIDLLRKQMDVEILKHQIQPHFLYNTLDSIRGQALIDHCTDIADTLKALSQYFHYNVQNSDDFVCIAYEIQNIKDYFFIQHFRFGDRYTLEWDYDPEDLSILNTSIPKFTLQPIVENSIVHGFSNILNRDCIITIKLEAFDHVLIITCSDNGIGIQPDQLKLLQRQLEFPNDSDDNAASSPNKHGIALRNVHQRIRLIFGEQYGIQICSVAGIGTDIYIRLPFCED